MISYYASLYRGFLKAAILANIQYRASGMIWMIGAILEPLIYLVVWSTVAEARGGEVGGMTAQQFAAYYITLMMVNHLTFSWIMQVFQFRIQFGSLSHELLRPVHPIHADIADNIAFKIVQLIIMIPAFAFLTWYFEPDFGFTWERAMIALPVILLAFLVRFLLDWTLALAAFWTTRIVAVNNAYFALSMFLSGRVAPIALLPAWLQETAEIMPFYYAIAFPVEILMGTLQPAQISSGILTLVTWLVLALVIVRFAWQRAVRSYSAVGS